LLFIFVGPPVEISVISDASFFGELIILNGLVINSMATYFSINKMPITKMKNFMTIGSVPLQLGVDGGEIIHAICVLLILMTVVLGALGIGISGKFF